MDPAGGGSKGSEGHMRNVVSQVTVRALQEFDTGDMEHTATGSSVPEATDEPLDYTHPDTNDDSSPLALVRHDRETTMPPADTQDLLDEEGDENELDEVGDEDYEGEGDSDAELEENELVVLDPNHPLMKRFQAKLKDILVRRNDKLELELREVREAFNSKKKEREDIGVELYGVQQELARYQLTVENLQVSSESCCSLYYCCIMRSVTYFMKFSVECRTSSNVCDVLQLKCRRFDPHQVSYNQQAT